MSGSLPRRSATRAVSGLALSLLLAAPAFAIVDPAERLPDPAQEARAERLGQELRCLVCQNESIEDSNAALARDLRGLLRQQIAAGATDQQATDWLVARYGDFVLLRPVFSVKTAALWASPIVALLAGLGAALAFRRRTQAPLPPLTDAERARLAEIAGPRPHA